MESSDEIHVILKAYHFVMGRGLILLQKNKRAINIFGKKKKGKHSGSNILLTALCKKLLS